MPGSAFRVERRRTFVVSHEAVVAGGLVTLVRIFIKRGTITVKKIQRGINAYVHYVYEAWAATLEEADHALDRAAAFS